MLRTLHLAALLCVCTIVSANQLTVKVTAYNNAVASGADADQVTVSYIQHQSTNYKCRLSQGDTAVLCIEGLPASQLQSASVSVHSNKTSGAGSLDLRVGGQQVWSIADAPFSSDTWNGAFSDTYVTLSHPLSVQSGSVVLTIASSANSIYFEQLTLEYTPEAPRPYTVFLDWGNGQMGRYTEQNAGSGVELPAFAMDMEETWRSVGWAEQPIRQQTEAPLYYPCGSRYYPTADVTLYAIWRTIDDLHYIAPDTSHLSGEYFIVYGGDFLLMADGAVRNKAVPAAACELNYTFGTALVTDHAAPSSRYQLTFEGDSVWISHPASSTWLGHDGSSLTSRSSAWAWQPALNGTICFSFTGSNEYCLLPKDGSLGLFKLSYNAPSQVEHALLFPVGDLPDEAAETVYTSYPQCGVGIENISAALETEKIMIDGRLIIHKDGRLYDILGNRIE